MEEYFNRLREFRYKVTGPLSEDSSLSDKTLSLIISRYLLFLETSTPVEASLYESTKKLVEGIENEQNLNYFIHKLWLLNAINRYRCYVMHNYQEALEFNTLALRSSFSLLNKQIPTDDLEVKSTVLIFYFNKIRLYYLKKDYLKAKELLEQFCLLVNSRISSSEIEDLKNHHIKVDEMIKRFDNHHRDYYLNKCQHLEVKIKRAYE